MCIINLEISDSPPFDGLPTDFLRLVVQPSLRPWHLWISLDIWWPIT